VCRLGFWASILTAVAAAAALGIAVTTAPARSGPFCLEDLVGSCVTYPYTDVAAAAAHAINYFIQLAVVQPSLLKGEIEGLSLFSQYNPHGVSIALEDIGYLMMGVAFLFIAAAFGRRERLERAIRLTFITSSILAVGSLILSLFSFPPPFKVVLTARPVLGTAILR
jgi:uncharacterized membrane protein YidH (DUF202 family)